MRAILSGDTSAFSRRDREKELCCLSHLHECTLGARPTVQWPNKTRSNWLSSFVAATAASELKTRNSRSRFGLGHCLRRAFRRATNNFTGILCNVRPCAVIDGPMCLPQLRPDSADRRCRLVVPAEPEPPNRARTLSEPNTSTIILPFSSLALLRSGNKQRE